MSLLLPDVRVLVVDDDPDQIALIGYWLRPLGYAVTLAEGGAAALAAIAAGRFNLVVTDLRMPGISGLDVLEALEARWPGTPAIVLSAPGQRTDPEEARRLPVTTRRLAKPLRDRGALTGAIAQALAEANAPSAVDERP